MFPIRFDNVAYSYGSFSLNLSLDLPGNSLSVILGPSGSGKTTLLDLCAGFIDPDRGRILQGERDITPLAPENRNIGVVFQDHALFPHLSVEGNVAFGPRMRGSQKQKALRIAREKLELVGLGGLAKRLPDSLSGGERQRVSIARALATDPDLLLLDEPFSSLDVALRLKLRRELRRIVDLTGVTALLVTHDQDEALAMADYLALMNDGRIVREGLPQNVWSDPQSPFAASFLGRRTWLNISSFVERGHEGIFAVSAAGEIPLSGFGNTFELPAAVMLRSESISIAENGTLRARITTVEYTGSGWRLELKPDSAAPDDILVADWSLIREPPQVGTYVNLLVDPDGIRLIQTGT